MRGILCGARVSSGGVRPNGRRAAPHAVYVMPSNAGCACVHSVGGVGGELDDAHEPTEDAMGIDGAVDTSIEHTSHPQVNANLAEHRMAQLPARRRCAHCV